MNPFTRSQSPPRSPTRSHPWPPIPPPASAPDRRRRDRRRRRARGQQRRLLAGHAPGLDVLLLEKSTFPREKVCGDGLTPARHPRAASTWASTSARRPAGCTTRACASSAAGQRLHLDWPELTSFPNYGLVRPRADLDALLANRPSRPARGCTSTPRSPSRSVDRTGRVAGVNATRRRQGGRVELPRAARAHLRRRHRQARARRSASPQRQAPARRRGAPLLPAARGPTTTTWSRGWSCGTAPCEQAEPAARLRLDLRHGRRHGQRRPRRAQLVAGFQKTDYRGAADAAGSTTRPRSGACARRTRSARPAAPALPMGFNRTPHYARGLLLVGDSRRLGQPVQRRGHPVRDGVRALRRRGRVQALARPDGAAARARAASATRTGCGASWGAYYRLGGIFVKLIGNPTVMQACTRHGLPHPALMHFVLKLLANLYRPARRRSVRPGDLR